MTDADLTPLVRALGVTYSPRGVAIWLRSGNRNLDGARPIDLLASGEFEPVVRAIEALGDVPDIAAQTPTADALSAELADAKAEAERWKGMADEAAIAEIHRQAERDALAARLASALAVCAQIESMPIPADPGMSQTEITGRIVATIVKAMRRALLAEDGDPRP